MAALLLGPFLVLAAGATLDVLIERAIVFSILRVSRLLLY